jgi:HK97 gp10 family phage protein
VSDILSLTPIGFEAFDLKLKNMVSKVAKKIVRQATKAGSKNTLKRVKANAKSMVGGEMGDLIARNAKVFVFKHQRRGSWGVQIGMDPREKRYIHISNVGRRNYIPSALEFGHGNARPIPYIRRAWAETRKQDVKIMGKKLKEGIEREARRG